MPNSSFPASEQNQRLHHGDDIKGQRLADQNRRRPHRRGPQAAERAQVLFIEEAASHEIDQEKDEHHGVAGHQFVVDVRDGAGGLGRCRHRHLPYAGGGFCGEQFAALGEPCGGPGVAAGQQLTDAGTNQTAGHLAAFRRSASTARPSRPTVRGRTRPADRSPGTPNIPDRSWKPVDRKLAPKMIASSTSPRSTNSRAAAAGSDGRGWPRSRPTISAQCSGVSARK